MKVSFLGLGAMGMPMARRLIATGHDVTGWNRSPGPGEELASAGGRAAASAAEAVSDAEVIISVLADDRATELVLLDGGAVAAMPKGAIHVSCATISVGLVKKLAALHECSGQSFITAPLFGRPEAAANGQIYLVVAGDPRARERLEPITSALAQKTLFLGSDPCLSSVAKLANNFLILSVAQALGEAFSLVEKHGLPATEMANIIQSTDFGARIFKGYSQIISRHEYTPPAFPLVLGLKDIDLVLEAGKLGTVPMRTASLIRDQFLSALARGYGELDWSAFAAVTFEDSGLLPDGLPTR